MTKVEYIKESHKEANQKIWSAFNTLFLRLKKRSILLAYLWKGLAVILYGIVYLISWLAFIVTLFKNVKYSIHFMELDIRKQQLNEDQARAYLEERHSAYKRQLSYGNYSPKQQSKINHTFEYLFAKYPEPEPVVDDLQNNEIIHSLNKITDTTEQIHSKIEDADKKISSIKDYTEAKKEEDRQQKIFEAEQKARAEQRAKSSSKQPEAVPTSFNYKLSAKQLDILVDYCNRLRIFKRDITDDELKEVFLCVHQKPLQARHNKLLALMLDNLANESYISSKWQRIAGKYKCFTSKNEKLLNARDLSSAKLAGDIIKDEDDDLLQDCIAEINKAK